MEASQCESTVQKGEKRTKCSNYRPVSLTSIIVYKIFETIIRDKITSLLESHGLITHHQHGFRTGHSCTTQLLELIGDVSQTFMKWKFHLIVFIWTLQKPLIELLIKDY